MGEKRPDLSEDEAKLAEILTLAEAADILRMASSTAKKLAREGKFPGILPKVGTRWLVSKPAFFDWLAKAGGGPGA